MPIQLPDQAIQGPETTSVKDALDFLRRRRWLCVSVAAAILLSSMVLAFRLPPIYMSQATILIEQPAIPEDIVPSTITSYVDEQIQIVAQHIYTPDSVSDLIENFDLYPVERQTEPMAATIDRFVGATYLESISAEVSDDRGRTTSSTFAFIVGFRHSDPKMAQQVTAELAQMFLDENLRSRAQSAATTTTFLEEETERLADEMSEIELRIAEFKDKYGDALPNQLNLNMDLLRRNETELNTTEQELRQLRSQRQIIESELRTLDTHAAIFSESGEPIFSAEQRLVELRQQYLQLSSRYGPEHPDVMRAKREIEAIVGSGMADGSANVAQQRVTLEMERDTLLERYSAEHPDVRRIQQAIAALPQEDSTGVLPATKSLPNNPSYLQAQAKLEAAVSGMAAALERRQNLIERRTRLETNIATAPRIEQDWLQLNRGYNSARLEYEEIKRRGTAARLSLRLEEQNKGERFTLLKRAGLPATPIEPNRPAIIFLGVVLALGAGIGVAALVDSMDSTVRSAQDLRTNFALKPVGIIPYVRTAHDRRVSWTRRTTAAGVVIASLFVIAALA